MFSMKKDAMLVQDREDLIALLRMRFGNIEPQVIEGIYQIEEFDLLERLIMVAANAPGINEFLQELHLTNIDLQKTTEHFSLIEKIGNKRCGG